jgi:hypothetical protein
MMLAWLVEEEDGAQARGLEHIDLPSQLPRDHLLHLCKDLETLIHHEKHHFIEGMGKGEYCGSDCYQSCTSPWIGLRGSDIRATTNLALSLRLSAAMNLRERRSKKDRGGSGLTCLFICLGEAKQEKT